MHVGQGNLIIKNSNYLNNVLNKEVASFKSRTVVRVLSKGEIKLNRSHLSSYKSVHFIAIKKEKHKYQLRMRV